jgi:uncharacterized membrane protein
MPIIASHPHLDLKHIFFVFVGLAALFVLYNNEHFILDHSDAMWTYYFPVRWLLLVHGMAGLVALCLGASQFSARLRQRHAQVHRILGRCYVTSVVIAAPVSVAVTLLRNEPPLRLVIYTQASLWILTTAVAFYCIRRRNYQQHRQWMIRSYSITLIFLTDRVLDAIPGVAAFDTDADPSVAWLCNVIAWVVPTFLISCQNVTSPHQPLKPQRAWGPDVDTRWLSASSAGCQERMEDSKRQGQLQDSSRLR